MLVDRLEYLYDYRSYVDDERKSHEGHPYRTGPIRKMRQSSAHTSLHLRSRSPLLSDTSLVANRKFLIDIWGTVTTTAWTTGHPYRYVGLHRIYWIRWHQNYISPETEWQGKEIILPQPLNLPWTRHTILERAFLLDHRHLKVQPHCLRSLWAVCHRMWVSTV